MFDGVLNGADRMWRRYQDPTRFSFTANGSGLHRTTCAHVHRLMPTEHTRPEGEAYDRALQQWHTDITTSTAMTPKSGTAATCGSTS